MKEYEIKLINKVQEINKLLYEISVIMGNREYEAKLNKDKWVEIPDGKLLLKKIPSIVIKIIDRY